MTSARQKGGTLALSPGLSHNDAADKAAPERNLGRDSHRYPDFEGMTMKWMIAALALSASFSAQAFPWFASGNGIRGADLMTPQERQAHVARLQSMKSLPECEAYWTAHNKEIDARAKKQGEQLPPVQGDPCQIMVTFGRIK
jgi:hypothetical protein